MKSLNKLLTQGAFAALLGAGALAVAATSASAAVVCNGEGACWHTHDTYTYPTGVGIVVHPDDWKWHHHDHYTWREHEGRGYWHNGVWVTF
jgi:hypothetical protein